MAIGNISKCLFYNKHLGKCCVQYSNIYNYSNVKILQRINLQCYHHFHLSCQCFREPKLTPNEVTSILRENEYSREFTVPGSVKSYDSNQLRANNPIEDTRTEARCVLTTGTLVGVFDGHGGAACAQVVAKRLLNYIAISLMPHDLLTKTLQTLSGDITLSSVSLVETYNDKYDFVQELKGMYEASFKEFMRELSRDDRKDFQMEAALKKAFLRVDDDLSREALQEDNGKLNSKTLSVALSGAVACVAHIDGAHLHVASVGDCQAVLGVLSDSNAWVAKKVSVEHNTDNTSEVDRIVNEHPQNEQNTVIKMGRLLGQLAPLRAFGDFGYKWSRNIMSEIVEPHFGYHVSAPNYYTPPYLTACPDVTHHRLTPRDRFLIIASDGLWDLISPLQAVRLVGEHMSGKLTLSPLRLPRKDMQLAEIQDVLVQRKEGLTKKPADSNAATHLLRHALGGTEYGVEHSKIAQLLSTPQEVVRFVRDDITITVIYFDPEYLRHCPP